MPLKEIQNLAYITKKTTPNSKIGLFELTESDHNSQDSNLYGTKSRSRLQTALPREVRLKAWNLDTLTEAPRLNHGDAQSPLNMSQLNGFFKEGTPDASRNGSTRVTSSPVVRNGKQSWWLLLLTPLIPYSGLLSPAAEQPSSPEPQPWSSAIGHASTGKSGRVIERLQGDIDRLHREKLLLKARFEDSEKQNESLATRNQYLQDRNSNYEQSHEANQRQLLRKDRLVEELREVSKREKLKTVIALETARAATESEENWRIQANQAKSVASQKEIEYDAIVSCRNRDNERHQSRLDKMKEDFEVLLRQWEEDLEKQKKLEIIAEQQRQTINTLEEHKKRLSTNFKAYRSEIDTAVTEMREHVNSNDSAVETKLDEMTKVTGEMRWVINVEQEVNKARSGPAKAKPKR